MDEEKLEQLKQILKRMAEAIPYNRDYNEETFVSLYYLIERL